MPSLTPVLADASSNLLAARSQMGFTLGFHIVLACFGVAFPAYMLIAEYRGRKRNDEDAIRLARNWSKAVAVLIAVGAVSGTVLSFEFGLLWPRFTGRFGDAFGVGFAIEGIFFFLEAIFIAIYIYGWDRLSPRAHMWSAVPIVISGVGGAFSVVAVNSWMNQPQGFTLDSAGNVTDVKPLEVLFNPAAGYEFFHMLLAAYMVAGFLIASVYAVGMLRGRRDRYHRLGFIIPFTVAAIATPIQLFVGDTAARSIADDQPAKFAAMECIYKGGPDQTEYLGGRCVDGQVKGGIGIPGLDSFLVGFSKNTDVTGLNQIPKDDQPPAKTMLHLAFDTMVGIATLLFLLAAWFAINWWRSGTCPRPNGSCRAAALAGSPPWWR
jgi:cytochrome d ubiquinol oxidase subunit I